MVEGAIKETVYPGGNLEGLYGPITYGMAAGGKRVRPVLTLMAAEAFGGEKASEEALNAALGIEMFHNFTLLHDDVMDNSSLRRGRPSVFAKWDANTAILSGDTMLTLATEKVMQVPDGKLRRVLDIFNRMAIDVYEGQRLDMNFEGIAEVSMPEYLEMIRKKTGALLGGAAEIGAIIGGADEKEAAHMRIFGEELGIAFQMEDDWLDTFGDPATFGKPIGGDIRQNKKTFLMISALESNSESVEALKAALLLPDSDTKVKTVTRIYEKIGVRDSLRQEEKKYISNAISAIKKAKMGEAGREAFRALAEKLTGRRK